MIDMGILKISRIVVKCPLCGSVLKLGPNDIYLSYINCGCFQCPVCKKRTVIYYTNGELNKNIDISIVKENKLCSNI